MIVEMIPTKAKVQEETMWKWRHHVAVLSLEKNLCADSRYALFTVKNKKLLKAISTERRCSNVRFPFLEGIARKIHAWIWMKCGLAMQIYTCFKGIPSLDQPRDIKPTVFPTRNLQPNFCARQMQTRFTTPLSPAMMLRSITQMALVGLDDDGCGISSSMMVKHRFQQIPKK